MRKKVKNNNNNNNNWRIIIKKGAENGITVERSGPKVRVKVYTTRKEARERHSLGSSTHFVLTDSLPFALPPLKKKKAKMLAGICWTWRNQSESYYQIL